MLETEKAIYLFPEEKYGIKYPHWKRNTTSTDSGIGYFQFI